MKICYLSEPASYHTIKWITYFAKQGHEITLLSLTKNEFSAEGINSIYVGPDHSFFERIDYLVAIHKVKRILREIKPDIFHVHYVTKWGWLAALSNYHPFILTAWGSDLFIDAKKTFYHKFLTKYALKRADIVTANSHHLLQKARELGASSHNSHIVQFGIDLSKFRTKNTDQLRKELEISNDSIVIFSPRMMQPVYNIQTIIETIPLIIHSFPKTVFVFINHPHDKYAEEIKEMLMKKNIINKVRLVPKIPNEDMPLYFSLAKITISIPFSDSSALSVLEAMACGSIPVVSDLPALKEIVENNINGLIVSQKDPMAIAEAIKSILRDLSLQKKIQSNNLETIPGKADQQMWMSRMEDLYSQFIPIKK